MQHHYQCTQCRHYVVTQHALPSRERWCEQCGGALRLSRSVLARFWLYQPTRQQKIVFAAALAVIVAAGGALCLRPRPVKRGAEREAEREAVEAETQRVETAAKRASFGDLKNVQAWMKAHKFWSGASGRQRDILRGRTLDRLDFYPDASRPAFRASVYLEPETDTVRAVMFNWLQWADFEDNAARNPFRAPEEITMFSGAGRSDSVMLLNLVVALPQAAFSFDEDYVRPGGSSRKPKDWVWMKPERRLQREHWRGEAQSGDYTIEYNCLMALVKPESRRLLRSVATKQADAAFQAFCVASGGFIIFRDGSW